MLIYPAIDLMEGKAVRLLKGDYEKKTIYSANPLEIAKDFERCGATRIHLVDLEGAKDGTTPNLDTIKKIVLNTNLFSEVGGGIRSIETIKKYLDIGVNRVILGTAAVKNPEFLKEAITRFKEHIAVGVDIKDGYVAINGWMEKSTLEAFSFCKHLEELGVKTIICTDISKDGAMQGTNLNLYEELSKKVKMDIIASGGVSTIYDIKRLREMNIHGAIVGKAYYLKAIDLKEAIEVSK